MGYMEGDPNTALEKRLRKRDREDRSIGGKPPNLLNIALCGLASLPFLLALRRLCLCPMHPCFVHVHATNKETNQQKSNRTNRSMLKEKLAKDAKQGQKNM